MPEWLDKLINKKEPFLTRIFNKVKMLAKPKSYAALQASNAAYAVPSVPPQSNEFSDNLSALVVNDHDYLNYQPEGPSPETPQIDIQQFGDV